MSRRKTKRECELEGALAEARARLVEYGEQNPTRRERERELELEVEGLHKRLKVAADRADKAESDLMNAEVESRDDATLRAFVSGVDLATNNTKLDFLADVAQVIKKRWP